MRIGEATVALGLAFFTLNLFAEQLLKGWVTELPKGCFWPILLKNSPAEF